MNLSKALQAAEKRVADLEAEVAELRRRLTQAHKLLLIRRPKGGVTHDFNNFLAVAPTSAAHLPASAEGVLDARGVHCAEMIERAGQRGVQRASRLPGFARKQPLFPEPAAVRATLAGIQELLRRADGGTITITAEKVMLNLGEAASVRPPGDLVRIGPAGSGGGAEDLLERIGAELEWLQAEVSAFRHNVTTLDDGAPHAARERDMLQEGNGRLQASRNPRRTSRRAWGLAGGGVALVLLIVGLTGWGVQPRPPAVPLAVQHGVALDRAAMVGTAGALLFRVPERNGIPLAALPAGMRVRVRELVWKGLFQWAEVEAPGGSTGFVLTTEIDLSRQPGSWSTKP